MLLGTVANTTALFLYEYAVSIQLTVNVAVLERVVNRAQMTRGVTHAIFLRCCEVFRVLEDTIAHSELIVC